MNWVGGCWLDSSGSGNQTPASMSLRYQEPQHMNKQIYIKISLCTKVQQRGFAESFVLQPEMSLKIGWV
jgi:hypothetical protein